MRIVLLFLLPYIFLVHSQGDEDVSETGTSNFGAISYLFASMLGLLRKKPEILERDDVTVFTEDHSYDENESNISWSDVEIKMDGCKQLDETCSENLHSFVGVYKATFGLTPEEVAEQVLKVEKILEDHNKVQ